MKLRFPADRRTMLWMFGLMPGTVALQYARPALVPYLSWLSFYFAVSSSVVAHNHLHCPTFKDKKDNRFFANWISIFYGYPTFGWIPTHNLNHHKYVNKDGDATITWRFTNDHNLLVAVTYFFVSAYYQATPINEYIKKARDTKPEQYRQIIQQYAIVYGAQAAMLALAIAIHGVSTGVFVWAFTMGLPAAFALWTVMLFNYEQHVHTDPWSRYNHSRNWVGKSLNVLLFNNGYHTAHHEQAGLHWSKLPELHQKIEQHIVPELKQKSLWGYWFKQYVVAPFFPKLGTKQVGRAPFDTGPSNDTAPARPIAPTIASVDFAEAGTNASRV
jgi:fatty acid desaturase